MPRFFVAPLGPAGSEQSLPEPVVRHVQVLRLKIGDPLTLFDGMGGECPATLLTLDKRQASVRLDARRDVERETPYRLTLAQGLCSNEKMDWLLEKACELGVARIEPIVAARSVVRLSGERAQRRQAHWEALMRAACEQCGRNRPPSVSGALGFEAWLAAPRASDTTRLLLSPRGSQPFAALPEQAPPGEIVLLIGPEGGLDAEEEAAARAAGFRAVSLGARILRAETAGIAMLAALAGRWGGWDD